MLGKEVLITNRSFANGYLMIEINELAAGISQVLFEDKMLAWGGRIIKE